LAGAPVGPAYDAKSLFDGLELCLAHAQVAGSIFKVHLAEQLQVMQQCKAICEGSTRQNRQQLQHLFQLGQQLYAVPQFSVSA
jgi:hypothetical protein